MLVLSRKLNESICIADQITVKVVRIQGNRVYLGIEAPADVTILRGELVGDSRPKCATTASGYEPETKLCVTIGS